MRKRLMFLLFIVLMFFATSCIPDTLGKPDNSAPPKGTQTETPSGAVEPVDSNPSPGGDGPGLPAEEPQQILNFESNTADELVSHLSYLTSPIKGRSVSTVDGQLPNAPRRYRNGVHEGLDYYDTTGHTVYAAGPGTVIRADHDYMEMTMQEYEEAIRISGEAAITPPELLDKFRGMQVWILHDDSVVTRYCHLGTIHSDIVVGVQVSGKQEIATVGMTGMRSGVTGKVSSASEAPHLHFEIWHENTFLGKNRPVKEVRSIYTRILDH